MTPDRAALSSSILGFATLVIASSGCVTCGATWIISALLGASAMLLARAAGARVDNRWSAAHAWSRIGFWSGLGGLVWSLFAVAAIILPIGGWGLLGYSLSAIR